MNHILKKLIIAAFVIMLWGCSDDLSKTEEGSVFPRIEYSNCTSCYECLEDFQCPRDAIIIDKERSTVYIDQDKCIRCMACVNEFECQYNAIKITSDDISPAAPQMFTAISDSVGQLNINFIASGDDSLTGRAYKYELKLTDQSENLIDSEFIPPLPIDAGYEENWIISNMPENETINVKITVFDEMGQTAQTPVTAVEIMGEYFDLEAPAAINDLLAMSDEYTITLSWTAPSDPEPRANVSSYMIKSAAYGITEDNWETAAEIEHNIIPAMAGETETLFMEFTEATGDLYFAIRSADLAGNVSEVSNNSNGNATGDITAPAEITDLSAGNPGNTSIPLSWTAVGDNGNVGIATAYIIKYSINDIDQSNWAGATTFEQSMNPLAQGSIENITITGLTAETEYYFAIKAIDEVDNHSEISNSANAATTATADTEAPAPITDLMTSINDPEILLNWTATGDDGDEGTAAGYDLRYATEEINAANWVNATPVTILQIPLIAGTEESLVIDFLAAGTTWYFAITASDEEDNISEISNNAQALIPLDMTAPAAITDLNSAVNEQEITLNWTATGDDDNEGTALSYDLRWNTEEINETNWDAATIINTAAPQPAGTAETATIGDMSEGVTFYFGIKATDDAENTSMLSNICDAYIEIDVDDTPPAAITDIEVTEGQSSYNNRMTINWTAPGDDGDEGTCDAYEIRYNLSPITAANWESASVFGSPPNPDPAGSNESVSVTGLQAGEIYYFAIIGIDEIGNESEISNSPGGKICYQILAPACHDCERCIGECDQNAIYDAGGDKAIDPDLCIGCGDCVSACPWNLIKLWVIAY